MNTTTRPRLRKWSLEEENGDAEVAAAAQTPAGPQRAQEAAEEEAMAPRLIARPSNGWLLFGV